VFAALLIGALVHSERAAAAMPEFVEHLITGG
jgi:hypothetical protein